MFDALALGALAAAMILVARALRNGRTSVADAFFPLLLLHLGNFCRIQQQEIPLGKTGLG